MAIPIISNKQAAANDRSVALEVQRKNLTYLGPEKIESMYRCIEAVQNSDTAGDFTEFGVALGGSGIILASALGAHRRYFGFDVFGMIPPPSEIDGRRVEDRYKEIKAGKSAGIRGDRYYGYLPNLRDIVTRNFASFQLKVDGDRISLVEGLFGDTLEESSVEKIALAHIDCDWYEPVMYCLGYVWPRLAIDGYIILDDYNDWEGCRKATDEFRSRTIGTNLVRSTPHAVLQKAR